MKTGFFHNRPKKKDNTFQQLLKAKKTGQVQGVTKTVENYSAVLLLCLKDKFSFSSEELQEVTNHINETFDNIQDGYLSLNDIIDSIEATLRFFPEIVSLRNSR